MFGIKFCSVIVFFLRVLPLIQRILSLQKNSSNLSLLLIRNSGKGLRSLGDISLPRWYDNRLHAILQFLPWGNFYLTYHYLSVIISQPNDWKDATWDYFMWLLRLFMWLFSSQVSLPTVSRPRQSLIKMQTSPQPLDRELLNWERFKIKNIDEADTVGTALKIGPVTWLA